MAERGQKGYQNTSDDGVNEILEGFVLTPKNDGVIMDSDVSAGHTCSRFDQLYDVCMCVHLIINLWYMYDV